MQPNQAVFFETVSQMIEHLPVVGLRRMNTEDQNHEEASQNIWVSGTWKTGNDSPL